MSTTRQIYTISLTNMRTGKVTTTDIDFSSMESAAENFPIGKQLKNAFGTVVDYVSAVELKR